MRKVFFWLLLIITIFSFIGCKAQPVDIQEEVNNINKVGEQAQQKEIFTETQTENTENVETIIEETPTETVVETPVETVEERPSYFENIEDKILFTGDSEGNRIFPNSWYKDDINPKGEALKPEEMQRSLELMIKSQKKYFEDVLWDNLTRTHVLSYLEFYGVEYGGVNSPELGLVYLVNRGELYGYDDFDLEMKFNSEFSTVLLKRNLSKMDELGFKGLNPFGFEYLGSGVQAIKEGKDSLELNPELHKIGFLNEYAQSTFVNDFNSFAIYLFMGDKQFWQVYDIYPIIKAKTDLVLDFYHNLNPGFTYDYFRGFCETKN